MSHRHPRLSRIPELHPTGLLSDTDLLSRFAQTRDETAFELLVRRHAPMVLAACRRVLADTNDADDAFQATFLVLARKADSVTRGGTLAAWLHRVACRASLRIRADRARRTVRELTRVEKLPVPPFDPGLRELERVLDEELAKLPERHRVAFVLCCLEGKTGEEASRLLGCPPGTVSSRLTRARERLRDRLTRRGFAPVLVAAVLVAVAEDAVASALPTLIESALLAAPDFAARRSSAAPSPTRPAAVAEGVIRTMATTKLKALALLFVAGLFAVGGVLAATNPEKAEQPDQPPPRAKAGGADKAPPAPVVQLVRPQPGGLERTASQPGTVEAFEQVEMHARVAGALKRVEVDIGDRVKRGQLIAEIEVPTLAIDEKLAAVGVEQAKSLHVEAEARIAVARAEINATKGVVKQYEAELVAIKANLIYRKKQHDRIKTLYDQKAVDEKILDEAADHLRAAEAKVDAATVAVENAKADIAVKQSKLLQAEAGVNTAKANVEAAKLVQEKAQIASAQTKVQSPFDGVVARRNYHVGDYVRPSERGAEGVMFTLMRVDMVRVVVAVPERDIPLTEVGLPAEVTIGALPGMTVKGKIARLGFALEPNNRTMRVEIDVANPKGDIRPGMFATVIVKLGKGPGDALRVPKGAVVSVLDAKTGDAIKAVYVYRNGKARLTPVRVSYWSEKEAEIASGLTAEDVVALAPRDLVPKLEVEVDVDKTVPFK